MTDLEKTFNVPLYFATQIQDHAKAHYEEDGWDVLVECWTLKEILQEIQGCRKYETALKRVHKAVKLYDDHRREIQSEACY